ncbi:hypothetical protein CRENBAI_009917 [Crenichthys baileyi]|uniref:Otospiralin n=1 Tax=Crenichthys baileyi TaxID=28760 RepID=A0AAV9SIN0_9TELE
MWKNRIPHLKYSRPELEEPCRQSATPGPRIRTRWIMLQHIQVVFMLLTITMLLLLLLLPAGAEESGVEAEERQKRDVPNWAMTSSDFFSWVEELRKHGGYDRIQDLARTFWAHFPSADRLGYGAHEPEE